MLLVPPDEPALLEAGGGARRVEVAEDAVPAAARAHGDHLLEQHGAGAAAALLGVDVDVLELADAEPHPPLQLHRRVVVHARPRLRHEDGAAGAHAVVREDLEGSPSPPRSCALAVYPFEVGCRSRSPTSAPSRSVFSRIRYCVDARRAIDRGSVALVSEQHLHAAASDAAQLQCAAWWRGARARAVRRASAPRPT